MLILLTGTVSATERIALAEGRLSLELSDNWFVGADATTDTGRVISRLEFRPQTSRGRRLIAEMNTWLIPAEVDQDLITVTRQVLEGPPFGVSLDKTRCLKCVTVLEPTVGVIWLEQVGPTKAFRPIIAVDDWPNCEPGRLNDYHGTCIYEKVNELDISLEPSLAFRFQRNPKSRPADITVITVLLDGWVAVLSFGHPASVTPRLLSEIRELLSSLRG